MAKDIGVQSAVWSDGKDLTEILNQASIANNSDAVQSTSFRPKKFAHRFIQGLGSDTIATNGYMPTQLQEDEAQELLLYQLGNRRLGQEVMVGVGGFEIGHLVLFGKSLRTTLNATIEAPGIMALSANFQVTSGSPGLCPGRCLLTPHGDEIAPATGISAVQTITVTGGPEGGTITISGINPRNRLPFTSLPIDYDATASEVAAAFNARLWPGAVTATGGALPDDEIEVTFTTPADVELLTATNNLTGGTDPEIEIEVTTPGVAKSKDDYRIIDATENGPAVTDNSSFGGLEVMLQALAPGGDTPSLTVKVQHAPDDEGDPGTWADLVTFDAMTEAGAQRKSVAPGITINPHLRAVVSAVDGEWVATVAAARH